MTRPMAIYIGYLVLPQQEKKCGSSMNIWEDIIKSIYKKQIADHYKGVQTKPVIFRSHHPINYCLGKTNVQKTYFIDANLWKTLKFLESFSFQGYAATVYEKYLFRESNYCLECSITWGWLQISRWPFRSCTIFKAHLINSISLPRLAYFS